jgi:hypothetical protein
VRNSRPAGRTLLITLLCVALLQSAAVAEAAEDVLCAGCELSVGIGGTYHYWAKTGGIVAPITFDLGEGRYELGAFRFTTPQMLELYGLLPARRFADPYWGFSLSRRWRLVGNASWGMYVGLGASYKTETDSLDSTHWNFAEQLALRLRVSHVVTLELAIRHWSNAGIRLPNRGQDFATLLLVF